MAGHTSEKKTGTLVVALLFFGILTCYILQMSPAPILLDLGEHFGVLDNNSLLNLPVNIMYPFIIFGCLFGPTLDTKIGTRNLFVLTMGFVIVGTLLNFVASGSYAVLLIGRSLFGIGFGFGIPFIGSAIMQWFKPRGREKMNTLNGFFPFIGTLICFSAVAPLAATFGWEFSLGVWGIVGLVILIAWLLLVKARSLPNYAEEAESVADEGASEPEKRLFRDLLGRPAIRLLVITFSLDFLNYSFVATILPMFIAESGNFSNELAGLASSVAFPGIGLVGCFVGGVVMSKLGKRKPQFLIGSAIEFVGLMTATLGANTSVAFVLVGISLYAFGNGFWLPSLYCVPMELKGMTASKAGASFALISAVGFAFGFLSPIVGGVMTDGLMQMSGFAASAAQHVFGLRWTLFVFGLMYIINFICFLKIQETGPGKHVPEQTQEA